MRNQNFFILDDHLRDVRIGEQGELYIAGKGVAKSYWFYLKALVDKVPANLYWKDIRGVYLGCNDAVLTMAGLSSKSEIIGKTDYELPWKDYADALKKIDQSIIQSRQEKVLEEHPVVDNKALVYLTTKSPLFDDSNNVVGIIGVSLDITAHKNLEVKLEREKKVAEAAKRAKSEFVANMSHDIRTPITGMLGLIESLIDTAENAARREDASLLKGATLELLHLLNEVIEVVCLESGHFQPESEPFSLRELAESNIALLKPNARHKNIQLELSIGDNVPEKIIGQRYSLDRILLNLLGNAAKFTEQGHIKLSIVLLEKEADTVKLKFSVEDTGIGIPADKRNEIFDRFIRLTPSYKGVYKGNGLGLYHVKQYVDSLKGKIDLDSIEGKGSTFSVALMFKLVDQTGLSNDALSQDQNKSQSQEIVKLSVKQYQSLLARQQSNDFEVENPIATVLIVEDQPLAAHTLKSLLKNNQCAADVVTNGEDAVKKAQEEEYYLILMDIGLPGIDGIEATRRIRQYLDAETTPIIAVTGHGGLDKKQECLEAGMQDVFNKPLDTKGLHKILGKYVFPEEDAELDNQSVFEEETADISPASLLTIDLKEGASLAGGNLNKAKEMLVMLIGTLADDLQEIKQTVAENDMERLYDLIHRIYGGLCYCGVPRLRFLSRRLKENLFVKHYAHITRYVDELVEEGENVLKEVPEVL